MDDPTTPGSTAYWPRPPRSKTANAGNEAVSGPWTAQCLHSARTVVIHRRASKQPRFAKIPATVATQRAFSVGKEQSKGQQMRYYFHLQSDDKIVPDEEGLHLEGEKNLHGAVHAASSQSSLKG